ncbi:hypothetical protein HYW55_02060 [Candidatus Gottesmanbacteria bacterium]|nr:hypothetical protein [Candidatus Gottesmanbacteria bacterium]
MHYRLYSLLGLLFFLLFTVARPSFAFEDPRTIPNNKYGIHIVNEADLGTAARLVNSNGGDWGYVTVVIPLAERNVEKWNRIFQEFRRLHLIPLVRLATKPIGNLWEPAGLKDIDSWAEFLSSLSWVTKNRYIILFNEPNHAKEWGGYLSPEEYADILIHYSAALKQKSEDFFILPAGLDASAPNGAETMDEREFLARMIEHNPLLFSSIDGWTSHSYPNPGFSGRADKRGRGSLATYEWELELLSEYGIKKNFPVFITETGWAHQEGIYANPSYLPAESVAKEIEIAASSVWSDPRIIAITPFILNYQSYPFANFSWQRPGEDEFYPQFDTYQELAKAKGEPSLALTPTLIPSAILGLSTKSNFSGVMNSPPSRPSFFQSLIRQLTSFPVVSKFISSAI